jgi:hypothetical protein
MPHDYQVRAGCVGKSCKPNLASGRFGRAFDCRFNHNDV